MTHYWDERFIRHLKTVNVIFEVGSRYGDESLTLSSYFPNAFIHSFECNPLTTDICRNKLSTNKNIIFNDFGLGDKNEKVPFYSYMNNNDGASSFLRRIDFEESQKETGIINVKKLSDYIEENNISSIDLLYMDVQGFELNILKGSGDFIKKIKFVIMEEPKRDINLMFLPDGVHSKYIGSPTSEIISKFMIDNGFIEIERLEENKIEDNVMYKNLN